LPSTVIIGATAIVGSITTNANERPFALGRLGARQTERSDRRSADALGLAPTPAGVEGSSNQARLNHFIPSNQKHKEIHRNYLQSQPELPLRPNGSD